jgi:protein arginine kinase
MAWYNENGAESDVVISSRVRFARNLEGYQFGDKLTDQSRSEIIEKVTKALAPAGLETIDLVAKTTLEASSLAEKRYISAGFARERRPHTLLLDEKKQLAVMICEQDHVRIQSFKPGMALEAAYEDAAEIDSLLDAGTEIAYSESVGYLTQNPTDLGTGMRASLVLHLPALSISGQIGAAVRSLAKLGVTLRGIFGENAEADGALYQITNSVTMGMPEEEIIAKLNTVARQLIDAERKTRNTLKSDNFARLSDRVMRAKGILANAYILPAAEFITLWSDVRLGCAIGILNKPNLPTLNSLLVGAMPATLLHSNSSGDISASELDVLRAKYLRESLKI